MVRKGAERRQFNYSEVKTKVASEYEGDKDPSTTTATPSEGVLTIVQAGGQERLENANNH